MCIALLTTSHPSYALIVIDNRDEFILRPTSRPHWWAPTTSAQDGTSQPPEGHILSSRDLQRAERGTWLGLTKDGNLAVLTNYRESHSPPASARSRGSMVTAWLSAPPSESPSAFVERLFQTEGGVTGVGGFSLICGRLRPSSDGKSILPLAVVSNRVDNHEQVPWIAGSRGEVVGLSNTRYDDPVSWPKVENGKAQLQQIVGTAAAEGWDEEKLVAQLFSVLDMDTLPVEEGMSFEEMIMILKESVFIPPIGDKEHRKAMQEAIARGQMANGMKDLVEEGRPDESIGFSRGMYGTQRQTVILVDWDGNVRFVERALWDEHGKEIPRGEGDETFKFRIDGWAKA